MSQMFPCWTQREFEINGKKNGSGVCPVSFWHCSIVCHNHFANDCSSCQFFAFERLFCLGVDRVTENVHFGKKAACWATMWWWAGLSRGSFHLSNFLGSAPPVLIHMQLRRLCHMVAALGQQGSNWHQSRDILVRSIALPPLQRCLQILIWCFFSGIDMLVSPAVGWKVWWWHGCHTWCLWIHEHPRHPKACSIISPQTHLAWQAKLMMWAASSMPQCWSVAGSTFWTSIGTHHAVFLSC